MSNSLKWHRYEVGEIELILFLQFSPWVSISFIIPMKISKIGGNLHNHILVQECISAAESSENTWPSQIDLNSTDVNRDNPEWTQNLP